MLIGDNIDIFCFVHGEAENAGLLKLKNGTNVPQNQGALRK